MGRKQREPRKSVVQTARRASILDNITVVSNEEAEQCSMVICNTSDIPSIFPDNVDTTCGLCGAGIYHRPHVPKTPPKICIHCALKLVSAKEN